jgi:hypothetical protein
MGEGMTVLILAALSFIICIYSFFMGCFGIDFVAIEHMGRAYAFLMLTIGLLAGKYL